MPELFDYEYEPVQNRRKRYVNQGGLGNDLNGWKNPREVQRYTCMQCGKQYDYTPDLDCSDFGECLDVWCGECRKKLRSMRTNHPEMV